MTAIRIRRPLEGNDHRVIPVDVRSGVPFCFTGVAVELVLVEAPVHPGKHIRWLDTLATMRARAFSTLTGRA